MAAGESRRRGQRGVARAGARPRAVPGLAKGEPREEPDFQKWNAEYGPGTYPEYVVFRWLEKQGLRHGLGFTYQVPFGGGRQVFGAQVADFVVFDWLALMVNGIYWHYSTPEQRAGNFMRRAFLEGMRPPMVVVEVLDLDVVERTETTMRLALNGQEMPGAREGRAAA